MPRQPSDDGFGEALDVASGVLQRLASAPFPPLSLTLLTARGGRDEREGGELLCRVEVEKGSMSANLLSAAIKGNEDVLLQCLGLSKEQNEVKVIF